MGTVVTVAQGAELSVNGLSGAADNNEIIGGLQGQGAVTTNNGSTIARLTINNTDDYTFDGTIAGSTRLLIIKDGPGTQTFTGDNTYTGATTVNAGTLLATAGLLWLCGCRPSRPRGLLQTHAM